MSKFKTFQFVAEVIDGKILEFPQMFFLQCSCVKPLGVDIVKQYNKTECIVAKKVFLIYCSGQVFGSSQFSGVAQFTQYLNNACKQFCRPAFLTIDKCKLELNGCDVKFYSYCPEYSLKINGCGLTINGCQLKLN